MKDRCQFRILIREQSRAFIKKMTLCSYPIRTKKWFECEENVNVPIQKFNYSTCFPANVSQNQCVNNKTTMFFKRHVVKHKCRMDVALCNCYHVMVSQMVYTSLSFCSHVNPFTVALHLPVIAQIILFLSVFDRLWPRSGFAVWFDLCDVCVWLTSQTFPQAYSGMRSVSEWACVQADLCNV